MAGPAPESSSRRRRRRLGEILVDQGRITADQLARAMERHKREPGSRIGRLLVEMGHVSEVEVCEVVADQLQIPAADLVAVDVPNEVLALVPKELALKFLVLPWFVEGRDLYLIMADPTNVAVADEIAFVAGMRVRPVVAPESEVEAAVVRFYAAEEESLTQLGGLDLSEQLSVVTEAEPEGRPDEDTASAQATEPVIKLVNAVLADAVRQGASDIHLEPHDKGLVLRYRIDGLLRPVLTMPKRVQGKVAARIKVMSRMDIAERRRPQDGRTRIIIGPNAFDMRVSTLPTADGEKTVIRILAQDRARVALDDLGFEPDVLASFREILRRPQGMILVTGPTGSGKTSTLYASLNAIRSDEINIITIEDPVEYRLQGVNQVAVARKAGLSFADGLRSILRQDPDVVMVGEIRDLETAQVAFQAAQTGHLVLSTLHTNDAPSAATRLVEMGIPTYLVASSVIGILAQRLVRKLCACKTVHPDGSASPKGCEACRFSGFKGRTAVYELMRLTPRVRSVLLARGTDDEVRDAALITGMRTMYADGERKVARGMTILEEVVRAVPPDDPKAVAAPGEVASAPEEPVVADVRRGPHPRQTLVLVVDDDETFRRSLRETLEEERYMVEDAASVAAALPLLYQRRPDLVLTDLHMPGGDGLELLRRIRSDLSTCQTPVVLLTVNDSVATEVQALDLGADDFVTKPVERSVLLSRMRRSLLRAHLMRHAG